jgi:hypothetical protein
METLALTSTVSSASSSLSSSSLFTKLAAISAASAQAMTNYRLQLVSTQMTAQLNKKITEITAQSDNNPLIGFLQAQESGISQQQSAYVAAEGQYSQNGVVLADLTNQLGNLAAAAQAGDSGTFDSILQSSVNDLGNLAVAPLLPGFQSDGVVLLQNKGLGIQSSAAYDLSSAAGQAQATSDVQAAQTFVQQMLTQTSQNQQIAASAGDALQGQVSAISDQISQLQFNALSTSATQITTLKQQDQQQFHLIELAFGSIGQTASMLTSVENANAPPPPGSILSLLIGSTGGPTLGIANITSASTIGTVTSAPASGTGSTVSTTA